MLACPHEFARGAPGREARQRDPAPGDVLLEKDRFNPRVFILLEGRLSVHTPLDRDAIALLEAGVVAPGPPAQRLTPLAHQKKARLDGRAFGCLLQGPYSSFTWATKSATTFCPSP